MNRKGYKHTSLGWIPEDWEVKELGKFATVTSGGTPDRRNVEYWNGNIPWISTSLIDFNNIDEAREFITEAGLRNSSAKIFPAGTILMALYGQGVTRGKVSILTFPAATNQACAGIFPKDGCIDKSFLFQSFVFRYQDIRSLSNGGSQENLSGELVKSIQLALPSIIEQKKIAQILSIWDSGIRQEQQLIDALQTRHRGLMHQLLSGKKRLKGFEEKWKEIRLGSLGESYSGLTGKPKEQFGHGKPFVTYLNVFSNAKTDLTQVNFVAINEGESQNAIQYGDFLFTVSSETPEEVGMTSVVLDTVTGVYLNSFCVGFRLRDFQTLLPEYARFYFRSDEARKGITLLAQGSTRFNISREGIRNLILNIPETLEQAAITSVLQASDLEIQLHRRRLAALQQQKKGLMQVLLTGKVRVKPTQD
jgi:type I restriction enzyme S subunit